MNVKAKRTHEYNQAAVIDKLITGLQIVRAILLCRALQQIDKVTI